MRTVAPYRAQGLLVLGVVLLISAREPSHVVPALVVLLAPLIAVHPFVVADKAGLETLYGVLPVPRRTILFGYYAWALAAYVATAVISTGLAALLSLAEHTALDVHLLLTLLAVSWTLFALTVSLQFPLLIRFGYARISVLSTAVPLALVMVAVVRLHLSLTALHPWLPLLWPTGLAVLTTSASLTARLQGRPA
jgi:hypothetical protein